MMRDDDPKDPMSIETLNAVEAIRRRPSMYVRDLDNVRNDLLLEVLCLPLAEAHCGTCSSIEVEVSAHRASVRYDGSGPPLEAGRSGTHSAEAIFTKLFACRDHKEHARLGNELCRFGVVVVNAFSEWLVAEIASEGRIHRQSYRDGRPEGPFQDVGPAEKPSVAISFSLAQPFRGSAAFDVDALFDEIHARDLDLSGVAVAIRQLDEQGVITSERRGGHG